MAYKAAAAPLGSCRRSGIRRHPSRRGRPLPAGPATLPPLQRSGDLHVQSRWPFCCGRHVWPLWRCPLRLPRRWAGVITGWAGTDETDDVAVAGGAREVPRAPGHRLGHLPLLKHGLLPALAQLGAAAPVVRLQVGAVSKYVVSDGDMAREILADKGQAFGRRRMVRAFLPLTGEGLFALEGTEHRDHRSLLAPAFSRAALARMIPRICEAACEFAGRWPSDTALDLVHEMLELSADITVRCLFRSHTQWETISWLAAKSASLSKGVLLRMLAPAWSPPLPTPEAIARRRATHQLRRLVQALPGRHTPDEHGGDVLSLLQAATCPMQGPPGITPTAMVDEMVTLLVASSEATAMTLAWAWHELADSPAAEQAVQSEADALFNSGRPVSANILDHLPFTSRVTTEILRLYPVPVMPRSALREVTVSGFRLPRGAEVLLNLYGIHRNPTHYPSPHTFDPQRWSPDAASLPPRSAYLPFSSGGHRCIGAPLAALTAPIALAALAARFKLRPVDPHRKVRAVPGVVTRPNRLVVTATARHGMRERASTGNPDS
ncbi:cytochrome P450 [Streptomyces sp. NPDC058304]|uniref:cytochrome P450 n=1 Tax=Streptomyces sp. NPDC058304 TaxID=3346437 RepID=UPI0036E2F7DC